MGESSPYATGHSPWPSSHGSPTASNVHQASGHVDWLENAILRNQQLIEGVTERLQVRSQCAIDSMPGIVHMAACDARASAASWNHSFSLQTSLCEAVKN